VKIKSPKKKKIRQIINEMSVALNITHGKFCALGLSLWVQGKETMQTDLT
jgi:hypothetical protein